MKGYTFIIVLVLILLVIVMLKKQNENYSSCAINTCSFKNSLNNYNKDNKNCNKESCYVRCADKNITIPRRFLSGQSDSILGYQEKYPTETLAGIYQIGEIDLFNNPRTPLGYNSIGRINNNDYNTNVFA
jgi:hypothetical protein